MNYSVDANSSTSSRSGTITVGGQTFTISQAGASCSYALSASTASYTSAGGSGSVSVTAGSGCAWTGTTSYAWLHTTSSGNGNGTVSYTADADASASSRSGTITVAGQTLTVTQSANQAPVAVAGPNQSVSVATTISFNGSSSYDPDGTIASYAWNFGDGSTGSGASVFHVFAVVGTYTVTLTVTDNLGATASASTVATVTALADTTPPSVSVTAPASGSTVSNTVTLSASASDNVGGSGVARVEFYCDSVVTPLGTATTAPYTSPCNTTAMANGSHSFYAKAYDAAGNSANSATVTVTVNNGAPTGTPGQLQWLKATAASANATTYGVATDHAGNVVVVGKFSGTLDFGGGPVSAAGGSDAFIVKYTAQGGFLWAKRLGDIVDDSATGVAVDSQDNIIVTGYFAFSVDFGGGAISANTTVANIYAPDIFVVKYSPLGTHIWSKGFGGVGNDLGMAVGVDGSDNVVLAAQSVGTVNFGGITLTGLGGYDIALIKLSAAAGATMWAKLWGGSAYDYPNGVAIDRSGDVVLTGVLGGGNLGGGTLAAGAFVAKYSGADGSYRWAKVVAAKAGNAVATDPNTGNIFVTGGFSGSVDFGGGPISTLGGGGAVFLAAYDPSGSYLWAKCYGGEAGHAVSVDGNGNLALAGKCDGAIDWQGTGLYTPVYGFFVATFTTSGTYRWAKCAGGSGTGCGNGVAFDSLGHVITAGWFEGTTDFGGVSATASGAYPSAFTVQYSK